MGTDALHFEPGEWAWSRVRCEPVKIIDVQSLWHHDTYTVWLPSREIVQVATGDDLAPIDNSDQLTLDRIVYIAAVAKINDTLSQDVLVAPLISNLIPLPHQIYTLSHAISGNHVRYLLADEVGLGKTIEAGLIMKELKLRGLVQRILIVVPKGLINQWIEEMRNRFGETFHLLIPKDFTALRRINDEDNLWRRFDQIICPVDSVKPIATRRGWGEEQIDRYNRERFRNLIAARWDLIIVDEAHRLAGSTDTVARYRLGKGLSEASPYLLLLSGTPHQGKTEPFHRLMSLIDEKAFPDVDAIQHERVAPYVVRTDKREAIDLRGNPLFLPRKTQLVKITWEHQHSKQRELYEAVTDYVRDGYNRALEEKRNYIGFLMVLMQRLVTSSTRAIGTALERRLAAIENMLTAEMIQEPDLNLEWWEMDSQERLEELLAQKFESFKNEREEIKSLLSLTRQCELSPQPDARAEALLEWMYKLQREENDPDLKFLVFTEFVSTQEMLREFLEIRGFRVACLNGSMDLDERHRVQEAFARDARVMVSTEAGGEGLNLQFCHITINYDLPWNPMRLEQRIGRVDRIGQHHIVRALNFVLEDTVERRVQEVLEEKLSTILTEFGVDKMSDVLDSAEAELDFDRLYMESILSPERIEEKVDELADSLRKQAQEVHTNRTLFQKDKMLDPSLANKISGHPFLHWVERMTTSYLASEGGKVERNLFGYDLSWPDGKEMKNVTFTRRDTESERVKILTLEEPKIRSLTSSLPRFVPGQSIPIIEIKGLPAGIHGCWSLWKVSLSSSDHKMTRVLALFLYEDGRMLMPTAAHIWDRFLDDGTEITPRGTVQGTDAEEVFRRLEKLARTYGENLFLELQEKHRSRVEQEQEKMEYFFGSREETIMRIGLDSVRQHRLKELDSERTQWEERRGRWERIVPELEAILIVHVEEKDG